MRATPLFMVTLVALGAIVSSAPSALADHCGEQGYEVCRAAETVEDIRGWLIYCVKQKFVGDSWTCLPNPYP